MSFSKSSCGPEGRLPCTRAVFVNVVLFNSSIAWSVSQYEEDFEIFEKENSYEILKFGLNLVGRGRWNNMKQFCVFLWQLTAFLLYRYKTLPHSLPILVYLFVVHSHSS